MAIIEPDRQETSRVFERGDLGLARTLASCNEVLWAKRARALVDEGFGATRSITRRHVYGARAQVTQAPYFVLIDR